MNVVSLFDGMSCGRIALSRLNITPSLYLASEIDKAAMKVSKSNYTDVVHIGDATEIDFIEIKNTYKDIDLLLAGSPCQSISNLGKGEGLRGKSGLFWEFVRALEELKPKYFLLENVAGNKKAIDTISDVVGVQPILINSNLFSAQNRKRYYWTNIPIDNLPIQESSVNLVDVLDEEVSDTSKLTPGRLRWLLSDKGQMCVKKGYASIDKKKANCLTARSDASWNCNYVTRAGQLTKLSPEEYEKLQTVPVGYTNYVSTAERYKMLGNGWTVDVIKFILSNMPQ